MTEKRIPKPGEVWRGEDRDQTRTVVNVYPDAVTYIYGPTGELYAMTPEQFVENSNPPEPTVVDSRFLTVDVDQITAALGSKRDHSTHRLDLMSDGEFRVVKL